MNNVTKEKMNQVKEFATRVKTNIEEDNNKLSKPYRIKTKLTAFEKELTKAVSEKNFYDPDNIEDELEIIFEEVSMKVGIPEELISTILNKASNFINDEIFSNLVIITPSVPEIKGDDEVLYEDTVSEEFLEGLEEDLRGNDEFPFEEIVNTKKDEKEEASTKSSSSKKKKEKIEINFQDTFDKSFNRVVVKANPIATRAEATNLVRQYYDIQKLRIGSGNRQFQLDNSEKEKDNSEKNISFAYANEGLKATEEIISKWLKQYVEHDPIGKWLISIKGIGPVLAAGLISYIDITKCQTAGSIWKYAGWEGHRPPKKKGVKLDYNPDFRVLCWKCGEQFQKVSGFVKDKDGNIVLDSNGNPIYRSLYGSLYAEKLKYYIKKNEEGGFAEAAKRTLEEKNITAKETKATYESGKLPMAHLISMAKRYAVKMFLSHLFEVWYEFENKHKPPRPFAEVILGHVHIIEAPNKDILGL